MLTPRFEIIQTDNDVTICVHAPYADIRETEVYVEGTDFRFYSTPYYLRLKLPGKIQENDSSSGCYDSDKGDFVLRFSKVNKGEYFPHLDMITTLLAPSKKKTNFVPKIEVIGNPSVNEDLDNDDKEYDAFLPFQDVISLLPESPKYGFANRITKDMLAFEDGFLKEVIDIPAPNMIPQNKRRDLREKKERADFNEEHYLADFMEPDHVEPYILYIPEWYKLQRNDITFSSAEVDLLKELPNREYLLTSQDVYKLRLGVIDILFGSCYNHRTTMGENTVESSWAISKLSSTLSWFDEFSTLKDVLTACVRRSLIYPFFRNWELSMKVLEDIRTVLKLGTKYIVKRFCEIHHLFSNGHEPHYVLNKLYIEDYLIWLQQTSENEMENLAFALCHVRPSKDDMQLDLIELEEAAYLVAEEDLVIENTVHEVVDHMDELTISNQEKNKPENIYFIEDKRSLKYLLSSSSDESDSESASDSDTMRLSDSSDETDSDSVSDSDTTSSSDDSDSESCSSTNKKDNEVDDSDDTSIPDLGFKKDSKNSNCDNSNKEYFVYDSDDASIPE